MLSPSDREQRIYALFGAALAEDLSGLHALTEDLSRPELAGLVEDLARIVAHHLSHLVPAKQLIPIVRQRSIETALEGSA